MPDFTEEELLQIIATGESDRVEFKESLSGDAATRIREGICTFANDLLHHKKPGLIFVGVKDDRTMGNIAVTDQLLRQLADIKTLGFVQRFGVGIPIAKRLLSAAGHPEPKFDISNNFVRVIVKGRETER